MSKKEIIGYLPSPAVPSPQQLGNSIKALTELGSSADRIKRYRSMLPRATRQMNEWEASVRRIKEVMKG